MSAVGTPQISGGEPVRVINDHDRHAQPGQPPMHRLLRRAGTAARTFHLHEQDTSAGQKHNPVGHAQCAGADPLRRPTAGPAHQRDQPALHIPLYLNHPRRPPSGSPSALINRPSRI